MKNFMKIAAVAALMIVSSNINAQDEFGGKKGNFGTEIQFNPFSNNFKTFSLDGLKFNYFLSDKDALRLNLGLSIKNNTNTSNSVLNNKFDNVANYRTGTSETETKTKETNFKIGLGYERHLLQKGRVDLYVGAELGYLGEFFSGEQKQTINSTSFTSLSSGSMTSTTLTELTETNTVKYSKMMPTTNELPSDPTAGIPSLSGTPKNNTSNFFANVFTGINFYIYKGLYVGTELGLGFKTGKSATTGTFTYDHNSTSKTIKNSNIPGATNTTTTVNTNWNYASETGVVKGNKNTSVSGTTPTEDAINNAYAATNYKSSSTSFKVYIEPALRLGWTF